MSLTDPTSVLRQLFDQAVVVADPVRSLAAHLPPKPAGRVVVVGAGKASARMAEAVEAAWGPCEGLVITRYGYARACKGIEVVEASHPVPDAAGVNATHRMLALLDSLGEGDFVLALISGGASALLCAPAKDLSLDQKQAINQALLASGAPIGQMNTLRKHLSAVKGGQLAARAYPARMLSLMISDVPGDAPDIIGSGPTTGEDTTSKDARAVARRWAIALPIEAEQALAASGVVAKEDPRLQRVSNHIYAAPSQSLAAAENLARSLGYDVAQLGHDLEGEAREIAAQHAAIALQHQATKSDKPLILLSGGELTVTRRGDGIGGPNTEYCLALAIALQGAAGVYALACDTDGVDGAAEVAGAIITPDTLNKASTAGLDARKSLGQNDAHRFFAQVGGQVITGPTLTNVNDFRAILIR